MAELISVEALTVQELPDADALTDADLLPVGQGENSLRKTTIGAARAALLGGASNAATATALANDAAAAATTAANAASTAAGQLDASLAQVGGATLAANNAADFATTAGNAAGANATAAEQATDAAISAAGTANTAASNANTKANLADAKATLANNAAANADTKAALADTKATLADTKAGLASAAATSANDATAAANSAVAALGTAKDDAIAATANANSKATLANNAATAALSAAATVQANEFTFTATAGQAAFTLPVTPGVNVFVYKNGARLKPSDFTRAGAVVTLGVACTAGDFISVVVGEAALQATVDHTNVAGLAADLTAAKARANHTGTQAISTVTGLQTALDGKVSTALRRAVYVTDPPFNARAGIETVEQARLNRAAFNAAIAFLHDAGGGVLRVPAGAYHIAAEAAPAAYADSYIYLRGGVHLAGAGMDSTRLVRASAYSLLANAPTQGDDYTSNGTDFRIERLTLDGNPTAQNTPANFIYLANATGIVIEDVRFLNCPGLHSLDINGVKAVNVARCRFEGHDHDLSTAFGGASYVPEAIQLGFLVSPAHQPVPCDGVRIRDCYFGPSDTLAPPKVSVGNHTAYLAAICTDIVVEGCTMEGMTGFGARPFCWQGATFRGNKFIGCAHGVYITSAFDTRDGNDETTGVPQSNSDIVVDGNYFVDTNTGPVVGLSAAGGSNAASYAKAKRVSITNNTIIDSVAMPGQALFFLAWTDGLTVTGNMHTGTRQRGVQMRFCSNASIVGNMLDTYSADGITINETGLGDENTWQGAGLSDGITLSGNKMAGSAFYGINLAGALSGVVITGNGLAGVGDPNPRPAIILQSGIGGAVVEGNLLDGSNGGMTLGVDVRAGCNNIAVGDNQIMGATTAPYSHAGTGRLASGGAGTPEDVIIAPRGSMWARVDGGAGSTLYVKEGGVGNAGWAAK